MWIRQSKQTTQMRVLVARTIRLSEQMTRMRPRKAMERTKILAGGAVEVR
jgi:hypothetical protein